MTLSAFIPRFILPVAAIMFAAGAAAQPSTRSPLLPKGQAVPPEVALQDLHTAYARTFAEETTVRFRAVGGSERGDDLVIRVQARPGEGVQRMLLKAGVLRVYAAGGRVTAISTSNPAKYVQQTYQEPLTPASLAGLMPPIPLPQLALAAGHAAFRSPTPYTPDVAWTDAVVDESVRGKTVTLTGGGPNSRLTLVANADTG